MTLQEILERIENVLNQNVDTPNNDLDLLRYDLENHIIEGENNSETQNEVEQKTINTFYHIINSNVLGIQYVYNGKWFMELYMVDVTITYNKLCR